MQAEILIRLHMSKILIKLSSKRNTSMTYIMTDHLKGIHCITGVNSPAGHWQVPLTQTLQFLSAHSSSFTSQCIPVKPCRHMHW